jgi:hypothetical protein
MLDTRLHYTPRTAPQEADTPDILVPALARLAACKTSWDALMLANEIPERLLPALAWHASRKRALFEPAAVTTIIKYCRPLFLERCLGRRRAIQLRGRYVERPL